MGINEYLESRDVSSSDVAPFLFIHTLLSAALVGSTWWFCYCGSGPAKPSSTVLLQSDQMPQSVLLKSLISMSMIPEGIKLSATRAMLTLEKASHNSKPVKYLEQKIPSLDATRLCVSFAEAKFGRLFFKPITVPARIWFSWKSTKKWNQMISSDRFSGSSNAKVAAAFSMGAATGRDKKNCGPIGFRSTTIKPHCDATFLRECKGYSGMHKL